MVVDLKFLLKNKFNVKKVFLSERNDINDNQIINYKFATKNVYKTFLPFPICLTIGIGGGMGVIGLIIFLLDKFL